MVKLARTRCINWQSYHDNAVLRWSRCPANSSLLHLTHFFRTWNTGRISILNKSRSKYSKTKDQLEICHDDWQCGFWSKTCQNAVAQSEYCCKTRQSRINLAVLFSQCNLCLLPTSNAGTIFTFPASATAALDWNWMHRWSRLITLMWRQTRDYSPTVTQCTTA